MTEGSPEPGHAARVTVRLRGVLADRFPGGETVVEVEAGERVERLVERLALPPASYVFVVNGAASRGGAVLGDGDRVQVHPPMAGG